MALLYLLLLTGCIAIIYHLYRGADSDPDQLSPREGKQWANKQWTRVGGLLGALIALSRLTHIPLAGLLGLLPWVVPSLREAEKRQRRTTSNAMTKEEARLILGVGETAMEEEIREAHKRLIQKNHPDAGGTDYLAARINQARGVLLS